jgi:hypothetical protein
MKPKILLTSFLSILMVGLFCLALAQVQQTAPPANPAPSITVEEAVMCTGVVDRVPQGVPQPAVQTEGQPATAGGAEASFPPGQVYCFSKISGTTPTTIKHAWYFGDKLVNTIELAIDGSPWRTWSYITIPADMVGKWKVDIQDANGAVLKTLEFEVK